ncbi:MAG: hypothetical protein RR606_06945, partial [Oscillospiraceae bacterium]
RHRRAHHDFMPLVAQKKLGNQTVPYNTPPPFGAAFFVVSVDKNLLYRYNEHCSVRSDCFEYRGNLKGRDFENLPPACL